MKSEKLAEGPVWLLKKLAKLIGNVQNGVAETTRIILKRHSRRD